MREFTSSTKVICGHMRLELKLLFSSTFAVITPGWCWRPYELLLSSNRLKRTTRSSGKQCFRVNTYSIVFQDVRLCWKRGKYIACFRMCCLGTKRNRRRKYSIENLVLFPGHYTNCCWGAVCLVTIEVHAFWLVKDCVTRCSDHIELAVYVIEKSLVVVIVAFFFLFCLFLFCVFNSQPPFVRGSI